MYIQHSTFVSAYDLGHIAGLCMKPAHSNPLHSYFECSPCENGDKLPIKDYRYLLILCLTMKRLALIVDGPSWPKYSLAVIRCLNLKSSEECSEYQ